MSRNVDESKALVEKIPDSCSEECVERSYRKPIDESYECTYLDAISRNVCIVCGKLDVPMVNRGWISPYCRECALHADIECMDDYDDAVQDERKEIVEQLMFSIHKDGTCYQKAIDIYQYVKKVRDYNATRS